MHTYDIIFSIRKNAKIVVYLDFYAKMFAPRFFIHWTSLVVFNSPFALFPNTSKAKFTSPLLWIHFWLNGSSKRQNFGKKLSTKNMSKKLTNKYSKLYNIGSIKEIGEFGLRMPLILS